MTETLACKLAEVRAKELNWPDVNITHREETLFSGTERLFAEPDTRFFIISADTGISVTSSLGRYNKQSNALTTQAHEHAGQVRVKNVETDRRNIVFVVAKRRELPPEPQPAPKAPDAAPKAPDAAPKAPVAPPVAALTPSNALATAPKPLQTAPNTPSNTPVTALKS